MGASPGCCCSVLPKEHKHEHDTSRHGYVIMLEPCVLETRLKGSKSCQPAPFAFAFYLCRCLWRLASIELAQNTKGTVTKAISSCPDFVELRIAHSSPTDRHNGICCVISQTAGQASTMGSSHQTQQNPDDSKRWEQERYSIPGCLSVEQHQCPTL